MGRRGIARALRHVLLCAVLIAGGLAGLRAGLIDVWNARDLGVLDDGDLVGSWTSRGNRLATAPVGDEPVLRKNATPTGAPAVRFRFNRLTATSNPVAGRTAFSLAAVFKVDEPGVDEGGGWSTKSGIVDANQSGAAADWGFAVRETGYICFGTGSPGGSDSTVYLDNQPTYSSVVDGRYHVAVCTWGEGRQTLYLDALPPKSQSGVSTVVRSTLGFSLGGLHTGEAARQFVGDLAEVQFHDKALTEAEAASLIAELSSNYISRPVPVISLFTASPSSVLAGVPLTLFWAVSNATTITIDQGVGAQPSATGSVQVLPLTSTTYTLTASNAAGVRTAQTTVTVDPGIPVADPQSVSAARNTPRAITLTGHDPQDDPLTFAIVQWPAHGTVSGSPPTVSYTPAPEYVGLDAFTFAVRDGAYESAPATIEIFVDDAARPPHGIFLNTALVDAKATPGTFLAALRAVDADRFDTHSFSLVEGPGGTDNGMFDIAGDRLLAGPGFPTRPGLDLSIRVRATDTTGLFAERVFAIRAEPAERRVVINEIHYNPSENTIREEFIELFNPGDGPVDLSRWRVRGGVDYVFGEGVALAAGGFLVVASDPATLLARYGVAAHGPWTGNLSSAGERVTLRDPADAVVDEVSYSPEFPWPIAANGGGPSIELIHPALDNDLGSSWSSSLDPNTPSPGAANRVFATNAPPNIRQVNHSPPQPTATRQVTVTAKVTDPDGVGAVLLSYQVVAPGSFIPSYLPLTVAALNANPQAVPPDNPAFEAATNWVTLPMRDDGLNGDAAAGDDVYSLVLPVRANRSLVRYRIACADTRGASRRAPFADDPSLNFAYFVYDGLPAYGGVAATDLSALPVYFLITRSADFDACTAYTSSQIPQEIGGLANEARFVFNWPGAFVYEGEVYDHIRYRLRGANGRYQPGKRSFRFRFNDGRFFAAKDEFGQPYARKWSSLNTAKGQSNRQTLTFALNEYVNFILLDKVGVPAPHSHYFHWRVVRGAQEAPNAYGGDFYGISWTQEEYDAAFLEAHGLPKGNLYKLINARRAADAAQDMVQQQRYQGPFAVTNGADAVRIESALLNPNASQTDEWLLANVNCTNWYAYHTILEAVRNYDTWPSANKNAAWYFDTNYTAANAFNGRFWTLPWDWTDSWGPTWNAGQDLAWNGIWGPTSSLHSNLQRDYRNTVREIRDLLLQPDQINPLIDAVAARLGPVAPADLARWSQATPSGASYSSLAVPGPGLSQGLAGYVKDLKTFLFTGGTYAWWVDRQTVGAGGWITRLDTLAADTRIPNQPTIAYVGQPGYPLNSLTFECLPFADPQGAATFAGLEWRLAEVQDTNQASPDPRVIPPLEWDAVWTSGLRTTWSNRVTIPGIYVQTNRVYRARVRHLDNSGRSSKWSAPIQFRPSAADVTALLREGLRISEIMYNPPALGAYSGDDLEFLELENIGALSLDLSGLVFGGITFAFPKDTILAPGQRVVLGRNATALETKYPGLTVHGLYTGRLDNAGESLRLDTPAGVPVLEVTYHDDPPWPVTADGLGWSLTLDDPIARTYRASANAGGSPGADDPPAAVPAVVVNELLTHTRPLESDAIELFNPTAAAVDLGGWFLSDDPAAPKKFRIPAGHTIPAGGYLVFDESDFNAGDAGFALSSQGDDAFLFSGDAATNLTGYVHGARFGAAAAGVSLGRCVNSLGDEDFVSLLMPTLGTTNARPRVGPVVISEIMFQPPFREADQDYEAEFVELQNVTATNVPLHTPGFPSNTWRLGNAIEYAFHPGVALPPGGRLLVVSFDPQADLDALARFRAAYAIDDNTALYGPWSGRLNNDGETIELQFPDLPELDGSVAYIQAEAVAYRPAAPWPDGAAGTGQSLQRAALLAYANDPIHWFAAPPTPGALDAATSSDLDRDGMPDVWEMSNGTDPFVADGDLDADSDALSNYAEWLAGTDPQDSSSSLKLDAIRTTADTITLEFRARAGRSYTILTAPAAEATIWFKAADTPAAAVDRMVTLDLPLSNRAFYRLVTPAQP